MSTPRSLADVIRGLDRQALVDLLELRPDLTHPRPLDLGELVDRAGSSTSVQLAVENLDAWQRRVCLALAASPDATSTRRLAALMEAERTDVAEAIGALSRRALVWGTERSWHLVHAARAAFGPHPAGLAPASPHPLTDEQIDALLAEAGDQARGVVDRLVWTNPTGRVARAESRGLHDSDNPVDRLIFRRLLRPIDAETIILPREVAIRLRGGRLFQDSVAPRPPAWPVAEASTLADRAGLGSAFELVRNVEQLVEAIARMAPRPLSTGALGRRDFAALVQQTTGDEDHSRFLLALARSAGLLASAGSAWLPTTRWDEWLGTSDWERWQGLREVWLASDQWPSAWTAILPSGGGQPWAPLVRRAALDEVSRAVPGTPVGADVLAARLAWQHPGWRLDLDTVVPVLVTEMSRLGLLALGRRTELVEATTDPGFPEPAREFMVQSDLTAVAPAPLHHEVARVMSLLAERESSGGAGVHRFTAESLRRALDAGWSVDEVRSWLAEHSSTPVPQALDYLLDDVGRRHGRVQVAAVASVVTCEDQAVVEMVVGRPEAAELGLRRVAPTVLLATADPVDLVDFLRGLGLAPVALDESGSRHTTPAPRRSRPDVAPVPPRVAVEAGPLVDELLARDQDRRAAGEQASLVQTLAEQITRPGWLALDFVSSDGSPRRETVRVMAMSGGTVRLMRKGVGPMDLPLARIIGVSEIPRHTGR